MGKYRTAAGRLFDEDSIQEGSLVCQWGDGDKPMDTRSWPPSEDQAWIGERKKHGEGEGHGWIKEFEQEALKLNEEYKRRNSFNEDRHGNYAGLWNGWSPWRKNGHCSTRGQKQLDDDGLCHSDHFDCNPWSVVQVHMETWLEDNSIS